MKRNKEHMNRILDNMNAADDSIMTAPALVISTGLDRHSVRQSLALLEDVFLVTSPFEGHYRLTMDGHDHVEGIRKAF